MRRFLILSLVGLLCTASSLYAQVPQQVSVNGTVKPIPPNPNQPESVCNSAGTFTIGQAGVTSQSNDVVLPIIYLCTGDSVFINHNGDGDLSGDAEPTTPPGIAWAIYRNAPTILGDKLQNIITDPEIILGANTLPLLSFGDISGDIWFSNFGFIQNTFNGGQPGKFFFAPITVDNFAPTNTWESAQVGFPPGPCVNANIADAFEVVYLNPISINIDSALLSKTECYRKFVVKGGLPEYDKAEAYDIDIFLTSDPSVKAQIYAPVPQYKDGSPIDFSVPVSGQYTVRIEDGKSCGFTGTIDVNCNPASNVTIIFPDTIAPPGTQICVPIKVQNFQNLVTANFTLQFDPTVLQYVNVQAPFPTTFFNPANNLNEVFTAQGKLGFVFFRTNGAPISIPNDGTIIQVCFNVIGPLNSCSPLTVTNDPSAVGAETASSFVGMTIDTGSVCIKFFPLTLHDTIINPTCTGTATLQVTASGGNDPYDVTWGLLGGGPTTLGTIATEGGMYTATLPVNGQYRVCVQDSAGIGTLVCDTITMSVPVLGVNLGFQDPKCNGDSSGTVTANVLLNSVPVPNPSAFTYDWAPAGLTIQGVPVQTGMPAGTYTVTVTNPATGCFLVAQGTMGSPSPISPQIKTTTPASCSGVEDGTISYIAEGGTPFVPNNTYDYTWSYSESGAAGTFNEFLKTNDNPLVITGRPCGSYQVTITDANGCTFTDAMQIACTRTVSIDLVANPGTSCAGGSDGSISIVVTATPPFPNPTYAFIWTCPGLETSTATTSMLSQLPAGKCGLTVIENSGCVDTATFMVTSPTKLVLDTVALKNPTCLLPCSGSISVSVTGGTPVNGNYAMTWTAPLPSGLNINTQSALCSGTYTVVAEDFKLCKDSLKFTLALPPAPVISSITPTPVKCGNDGALEAVSSAPGATFTWQILDSVAIISNTAKATNLNGGQYVVTLKDAERLYHDGYRPPPAGMVPLMIDTATLNIPKCFGDANGSIIPTVTGGQPAYKFVEHYASQHQPALNLVKAGMYTLTVTDQKGCTDTETFDLKNPPAVVASYTNAIPATCSDSCDGGVSIDVKYSDGSIGTFIYKWSDGGPADSVRTGLCPGNYTVTVTATLNSCFRIVDVIIGSPLPIETTKLDTVTVTCNGGDDGGASIAVKGGTSPYKFKWSTGALTATVSNLTAGLYAVTVTDIKGCTKVFSIGVTEPAPIVVQVDLNLTSLPKCFGNADGTVAVTATGGNPGGYTYQWKDEGTPPQILHPPTPWTT